jgi:hypothetical protein
MPALITDKFRVYNAKQFLESFDETSNTQHFFFVGRSRSWATLIEYYSPTGTAYTSGSVTLTSPTSAYTQKVLPVVAALENGFLVTGLDPLSISGIKFGDTLTWSGPGGATVLKVRPATEDAPLDPQDNLEEKYDYYREIIAAKRIYDTTLEDGAGLSPDGSYVRAVINRLDYGRTETFGIRTAPYDMWRPNYVSSANFERKAASGESGVANLEMVVRNPDYEVWMCIDNGARPVTAPNGATPVDPTTSYPRRATVAANADAVGYWAANGIYTDSANYRWKYLYTLNTTEVLRFQSQKFIPLSTFTGVAVTGPEAVAILDRGSGWANNGIFYAPINGDGQQSNTALKIVKFTTNGSGQISSARVLTSAESGVTDTEYTFASVQLIAGTSTVASSKQFKFGVFTTPAMDTAATVPATPGALEVIIPPQGGYGADLQEQLNAKRIMCNIRLTFSEGDGDFPITNDFRRIGLLRDPVGYGGGVISSETVRNTFAVKFNSGSGPSVNYVPDEKISQTFTSNGVAYTISGTVVEWLPTDSQNPALGGELRYYQDTTIDRSRGLVLNFGTGAGYTAIVGATSAASATASLAPATTSFATDATLYPELRQNSGEIIYVENRRLITRAADQIEDIKLVIEF